MPTISRLPSPDDGAEGLMALVDAFGEQAVYEFIRLCRTTGGPGRDPGAEALGSIAKSMVAKEQEEKNVDFSTARLTVATRLGYTTGGTRTNFYKILSGQGRADKRVKTSVNNVVKKAR